MRAIILLFAAAMLALAACSRPAATATLAGTVNCGGSCEGRELIVYNENADVVAARVPIGADGSYSAALLPGRYIVDATGPGATLLPTIREPSTAVWWPQPVELRSGETFTLNYDLSKPGPQVEPQNISSAPG